MADFVRRHRRVADTVDPLEVLWCLAGTEAGERAYLKFGRDEYQSREYGRRFTAVVAALPRQVRERQALTLEAAVRRLTSEVAEFFGIPDRGVIAPGKAAEAATASASRSPLPAVARSPST